MSARFSALRFVHPDFAQGEVRRGLCLNLRGQLQRVDERASVRQALLLLLSTSPGERVMRPNYGCDLMRLVYAPNDDTTAGLAMHYVREAVERWEPRVEITRLDTSRQDPRPPRAGTDRSSSGALHLAVDYRVRATRETDSILLTLKRLEARV